MEGGAAVAPGEVAAGELRSTAPGRLSAWDTLRHGDVLRNGHFLVGGVLVLVVLLCAVLADVASAWTLLVLPLASALIVKAHDVIAGLLRYRD